MEYAAGFLIYSEDKILICHPSGHSYNRMWSLPKGKIDKGETPLEAALRETKEECGIDLNKINGSISELGTYTYPSKKKKITIFLFKTTENLTDIELRCESLIPKERGFMGGLPEIDEFQWIRPQVAFDLLHPVYDECLRQNFH